MVSDLHPIYQVINTEDRKTQVQSHTACIRWYSATLNYFSSTTMCTSSTLLHNYKGCAFHFIPPVCTEIAKCLWMQPWITSIAYIYIFWNNLCACFNIYGFIMQLCLFAETCIFIFSVFLVLLKNTGIFWPSGHRQQQSGHLDLTSEDLTVPNATMENTDQHDAPNPNLPTNEKRNIVHKRNSSWLVSNVI